MFSQPGNQATALDPPDSSLITSRGEDAQERPGPCIPRVPVQKTLLGAGKEGNRVSASCPSPGGSSEGGAAVLQAPPGWHGRRPEGIGGGPPVGARGHRPQGVLAGEGPQ